MTRSRTPARPSQNPTRNVYGRQHRQNHARASQSISSAGAFAQTGLADVDRGTVFRQDACAEKMIETQKEYREKMKQIGQKLGVPIDPLQEIRRKPVKAPAKAPAKPAGSGAPADKPALSAEKPSSTSKI